MSEIPAIPGATYRLQFTSQFRFRDATAIVPYLHELGITHCYASPLFQASSGSTHGYDVCSFEQLNPELGTPEDFEQFIAALRQHQMGLLLDMVPNHMGNDLSNPWWRDVLEWGAQSRFAGFFDIDWQPLKSDLHHKVLLPVLEDHLGTVLEAGKLRLQFYDGAFSIAYYARNFPLAPQTYPTVLTAALEALSHQEIAGNLEKQVRELLTAFQQFSAKADFARISELKSDLRQLHESSEAFRGSLQTSLQQFNGVPGKPATFDQLFQLLQQQHYRLAFWRVGAEELNYRRFFDVTELVSLRMELPEVFQATHCLVLKLLAEDKIQGLRIDHPDGLLDPKAYFDRLQESYARVRSTDEGSESGSLSLLGERAGVRGSSRPLYILAEKILTGHEPLPEDWPIHGTTGYEFLNALNGMFVDSRHEAQFTHIYRDFTGRDKTFAATVYAGKKRVLEKSLISELTALTHRLKLLAGQSRASQDFTFSQLRRVLGEVIAAFPIYRTYITDQTRPVPQRQQHYIEQAMANAREHLENTDSLVLDWLRDLLLLNFPRDFTDDTRGDCRQFIMKFQQLTGPVMAKGLEDTAFYRYNRLVSLNEVGGDPGRFGWTVEQFHHFNLQRSQNWPHSLLATATHDTKRGEDVRATIDVLSEMPGDWQRALHRWQKTNASKKQTVSGKPAPDTNDEYLLYQTLIAAWPEAAADSLLPLAKTVGVRGKSASNISESFCQRIIAYMLKAIKEAKQNTSWTEPNPEYESACQAFVQAVLDPSNHAFLDDFVPFQAKLSCFGRLNSLSQLLLKITSPGVPDFYQGTELWDLSLVDPDNRRPVDYELRRSLLDEITRNGRPVTEGSFLSPLGKRVRVMGITSPLRKLQLIREALYFRNTHRELFDAGEYIPLAVEGPRAEHVCAFARKSKSQITIVAVPRLCFSLMRGQPDPPLGEKVWKDTQIVLPHETALSLQNIFTGQKITSESRISRPVLMLHKLFADLPIALLG